MLPVKSEYLIKQDNLLNLKRKFFFSVNSQMLFCTFAIRIVNQFKDTTETNMNIIFTGLK